MYNVDWGMFGMFMFGIVTALTVHEFAHAKAAEMAGDDTAKRMGRVSLNPLDHLDPVGTVMIFMASLSGIGMGWGKPVPVNHLRLKSPRWDNVKISLWGPLSNICMAFAIGMLLRFLPPFLAPWSDLLTICALVNISLAVFNMIPIAPLDGSHILSGLLPVEKARSYERVMAQYGPMILLGLIFFARPVLWTVMAPPRALLMWLFLS